MLWLPGKENSRAFKPLVRFGFKIETYTALCQEHLWRISGYKVYSTEKLMHFGKMETSAKWI